MTESPRKFGVTSSGFVVDEEVLAAGVKELVHFDPREDSMEVCAELVFLAMLEVMEEKMALSRGHGCAAFPLSENTRSHIDASPPSDSSP
jgi:hypothetical protein